MPISNAALRALPFTLVLSACGTSGESGSATFSSQVLADNEIEQGWCPGQGKGKGLAPPVLDPIGAKAGFVAGELAFQLTAHDPKRQHLTFSATGLPPGATLDGNSGAFTWKPTFAPDQSGSYDVLFMVDNGPCMKGERVTLTVAANRCLDARGAPIQCGQGDACNTEQCLPEAGCTMRPVLDETLCNDGYACTSGDRCKAGTCRGDYSCTPVLGTDAQSYAQDAPITVSYGGLYGHPHDWIALAAVGAPPESYVAFSYTGGISSGFMVFTALRPGTYVARAFFHDDSVIEAESAPFIIEAAVGDVSVTTSALGYLASDTVMVNFDGLPGFAHDWIGITTAGAPPQYYLDFSYTGGQRTGSLAFNALPPGSYVARAFVNDGYAIAGESAPFIVQPVRGNVTVTTDDKAYLPGAPVTVTYTGMPRFAHDWIGIALPGWPPEQYIAFTYTGGARDSQAQFVGLPAGHWVARAFENDSLNLLAESLPFFIGLQ